MDLHVCTLTLLLSDIQACCVSPEADVKPCYLADGVPDTVTAFYRVNDVARFRLDRPFYSGDKSDGEVKVLAERIICQSAGRYDTIRCDTRCYFNVCSEADISHGTSRNQKLKIGKKEKKTHTHTPFNGPFSGTTRVSRYQKGKTNLDFSEARDSEWQWHQLGHTQVCT